MKDLLHQPALLEAAEDAAEISGVEIEVMAYKSSMKRDGFQARAPCGP